MYVVSNHTIDVSAVLNIFVRRCVGTSAYQLRKPLTWYRWQRVGMTTQTRRRWNIKCRPSLRVQPDNLPQIIIRYASSAFSSSFTSSLIRMCVCVSVLTMGFDFAN